MFASLMTLKMLSRDRQGIAAIEYALIAALMCVILIAVFPALQTGLAGAITLVTGHLTTGT